MGEEKVGDNIEVDKHATVNYKVYIVSTIEHFGLSTCSTQ